MDEIVNIAMVEPFYSGSHKAWMEAYKKVSKHNIKFYTMEGRFWKWRMHGGAVTLATMFNNDTFQPDIIIASDMLDLTTFLGLTRKKTHGIKTVLYFHENQLSYPWSPNDQDVKERTDAFYSFINYTSALAADHVLFNSEYHRHSLITTLEKFLKQFPDYQELQNLEIIKNKTAVLPIGLDLKCFDEINQQDTNKQTKKVAPLILWNHRWESDKNPEDFFNALIEVKASGREFDLAVIGKNTSRKTLACFENAKEKLSENIIQFGETETKEKYIELLNNTDIIPVTSNQEFFGISVMEAVYCGAYPLLPMRLSYPYLFDANARPQLFYSTYNELVGKLCDVIDTWNEHGLDKQTYRKIAAQYDWGYMAAIYDELMEKTLK